MNRKLLCTATLALACPAQTKHSQPEPSSGLASGKLFVSPNTEQPQIGIVEAAPKTRAAWGSLRGDMHILADGKDVVIASPAPDGEWIVPPGVTNSDLRYAVSSLLKAIDQMNQESLERQFKDRRDMQECLEGWKRSNDALRSFGAAITKKAKTNK